jgi:hypothetical protein
LLLGASHMDIHLPKPFHNWREFLKEYGIIVLGVLTALGLEQAIESWHERQQVEETRHAIDAELRQGIASTHLIQDSSDCRDQQFQALAVALGKGDREGVRRLLKESHIIPVYAFADAAWTTALATGVANRFDQQERDDYVMASYVSRHVQDWYSDYFRSAARMDFLMQGSLDRSSTALAQAESQLADMYSIMGNVQGATSVYLGKFENDRAIKITQADYEALPGGSDFVQQCQAAAKAMTAEAAKS